MGVQSAFTWSWSSDNLVEKALPEPHTYTDSVKSQLPSLAHLTRSTVTLVEDGQKRIDIGL